MNGRIHDIYSAAEGMEDSGVYPGCGAACAILNKPCNYGQCEDHYDSFKCNCSISPFQGKYCQNSTCNGFFVFLFILEGLVLIDTLPQVQFQHLSFITVL